MSTKADYVRSQGQTRDHHCHWPGCSKQVPPASAPSEGAKPFGYWHEGPTEDESDFFLAKDFPDADKECDRCKPLYLAPTSPALQESKAVTDTERLEWLEAQAKASRTGVSFDWCKYAEDGYVQEKGYRFMRFHHIGERKESLRAAIDAELKGGAA